MNIFSKLFGQKKAEELDIKSDGQNVFDNPTTQKIQFSDNFTREDIKNVEPKDIPEAIMFIVETQNRAFLNTHGLINILNDFHLLKDNIATKNVLLGMLDSGYIESILKVRNWQLESLSLKSNFVNEYGTRQDLVSFIFDSFGYGLGFTTTKPVAVSDKQTVIPMPPKQTNIQGQSVIEEKPVNPSPIQSQPYDPKRDLVNYHYPIISLLDIQLRRQIDLSKQNDTKQRIVDILNTSFKFQVQTIKVVPGAASDFYEIEPVSGMNYDALKDADEEFTMFLSPKGVNVLSPIPGTYKVGIIVPKDIPERLTFEPIINSRAYQESSMSLPCAIGKDLTGNVFMFDLATLPHLLIGGASGQGKSICLHAILLSLLFKKHPSEVQFVLIDYKRIELGAYNALVNHFLAAHVDYKNNPIIENDEQAVKTFAGLKVELDKRFELIAKSRTRNIQDYNKKFCDRRLDPTQGHTYLRYLIIAIDEYSEISGEALKSIEPILLEIAKKGRTVGIHLIISTNRPTADVVSSSIKSELTGRIAFRVNTVTDSRLILNSGGAEKLIGNGDMYFTSRNNALQRVQCSMPSFDEIDRVCAFIQGQQGYTSPFEIDDYIPEPLPPVDMEHLDPMFEDAARLIVREQNGSTSTIQRRFAIGYNRAGRLMDQLEIAGIVGPAYGAKPRDVLIKDGNSLERILNKYR